MGEPAPNGESTSLPDRIAAAYLARAGGDAQRAIRALAHDAVADLCEAERRCGERDRLISAGYVRAAPATRPS